MIATYIQELLATNNRVIVPNYGAFLVRATSKSKDANNLEDKLKDIYFSPFLKFNDELLEKHIIKKESISKEEASEKIIQFVDDIKKKLDQEKPFEIKNFGKFVSDKQGKVQFFTFDKNESIKEKEEPKTEIKPPVKKPSAKKEEPKEVLELKKEEPNLEAKKVNQLEDIVLEEKISTPKTEIIHTPVEPKKPIYNYKKEKKPLNKGLIWSIAVGLPLAAIFVWGLLNFNTIEKVFKKDKTKTELLAKKKLTNTEADLSEHKESVVETKAEVVSKEVQQPAVQVKKYYIIAGSFKNERYADSYVNKLKSEGYNAEKLAKRNEMYAVSFNSFSDKNKAIAEYKFLAQEKGLQAWILYY